MTAASTQPLVTPIDRFGLTLCLAIMMHGIIILGVTFAGEDVAQPRYETMEIVLVQQQSKPDEDAKLLAQANLAGGGDSPEEDTPSSAPAPFPENEPEETAPPQIKAQPPAETAPPAPKPEETEPVPEPTEVVEEMTVESDTPEKAEPEPVAEVAKEKPPVKQEAPPAPTKVESENQEKPVKQQEETPPLPSATALLARSLKIASLSAQVQRKLDKKSKRPRRKFISASTKEYKYAAYMEAWRSKVERVGNLNYPEAARKQNLSGSLILDVALEVDGSVKQITVRRSSGHKILDDAAIRIVELSAPFAPFPDQIKSETDILHITRTWQFVNGNRFR